MEIYFDGTLIDSDYYASISKSFKLFDDKFLLGTTAAQQYVIEVPYSILTSIPINIVIKENGTTVATLVTDKYEIENNNLIKLTLIDKMIMFNHPYDASSIVPCTVLAILQNICSIYGIELATTTFTNSDVSVDYYDNTLNARDYIGYIAELNGGYAQIGADGKLYLKRFNSTPSSIDINSCEEFKIGEHHKIERVVFNNGTLKYETSADETLETLYLNEDNVYITSQDIFTNIANNILNFEYYNFTTGNCDIISNLYAGDLITFTDGKNNYQSIAQYDLNYNGGWIGGYSLDLNSAQQEETQQVGTNSKIKSIKILVDRNANKIEQNIKETQSIENNLQNNYTTNTELANKITQTVNETTNLISQTGGYNLLSNSQFLDSLKNWITSTDLVYELLTGTEIELNTDCKSGIHLSTGQISQSYTQQIGSEYTISFKYKKTGTNSNQSYVRIYRNDTDYITILDTTAAQSNRTQISVTYTAMVSNPKIVIYTLNDDFYVTDLIVQKGTSTSWSPNALETIGIGHSLTLNNLKLYNLSEENIYSLLNYTDLQFYKSGTLSSYYGADSMKTPSANITDDAIICGMEYKKLDDNNVIVF